MKAVIVDLQGKYAAALDETGSVVRIPDAAYRIGQEIELHLEAEPPMRSPAGQSVWTPPLLSNIRSTASTMCWM